MHRRPVKQVGDQSKDPLNPDCRGLFFFYSWWNLGYTITWSQHLFKGSLIMHCRKLNFASSRISDLRW